MRKATAYLMAFLGPCLALQGTIYAETPLRSALAIEALKKGASATGWASYYTRESCEREGTSGIMANGKPLDDGALTCALWGIPFGTKIKVTRGERNIIVTTTDRGPLKRFMVEQGRIIDLTQYAFSLLGDIREGLIPVTVERVN